MKNFRLIAPACLLLAACVSSGPESQLGTQEKAPKRIEMSRTSDCVFHRNIDDFHAIDDNYVVLYSMGRRKAYLAEIAGGCFDVKGQNSLAAVDGDRNGQICGFGRDSIAYRNLGRLENCRILGMQELTEERREELGLGAPKTAPREEPAPGATEGEARNEGTDPAPP